MNATAAWCPRDCYDRCAAEYECRSGWKLRLVQIESISSEPVDA